MLGNVWEWCEEKAPVNDPEEQFRSLRGGGWTANYLECRCATRSRMRYLDGEMSVGLRLILQVEQ